MIADRDVEKVNVFALKELNEALDFCVAGRRLLVIQCGKNNAESDTVIIRKEQLDTLRDQDLILIVKHSMQCSKAVLLQKKHLELFFYEPNANRHKISTKRLFKRYKQILLNRLSD